MPMKLPRDLANTQIAGATPETYSADLGWKQEFSISSKFSNEMPLVHGPHFEYVKCFINARAHTN